MPSYQDIESRLRSVEEKIEFVMQMIKFPQRVGLIDPKTVIISLRDMYYATKAAGLAPDPTPPTSLIEEAV